MHPIVSLAPAPCYLWSVIIISFALGLVVRVCFYVGDGKDPLPIDTNELVRLQPTNAQVLALPRGVVLED